MSLGAFATYVLTISGGAVLGVLSAIVIGAPSLLLLRIVTSRVTLTSSCLVYRGAIRSTSCPLIEITACSIGNSSNPFGLYCTVIVHRHSAPDLVLNSIAVPATRKASEQLGHIVVAIEAAAAFAAGSVSGS
jgi:hypothetical protein